MALTLAQTYDLARACQRAENAAEAITLTNNPATGLQVALNIAISGLIAAVQAVVVSDGQPVPIKTNGGANIGAGAMDVAGGVLNGVRLPSTSALVPDQGIVIVKQQSGATVNGVAGVVNSGVSEVTLPGTNAFATSGTKITAPVTGTGTTGVTPTIVNGVITALVLS